MPAQLGGAPNCRVCGDRVYFSEQKLYMSRAWHTKCFICKECSKALDNSNANLSEEDETLMCNQCHRKINAPPSPLPAAEGYFNKDDPECCPRCGKRVYFAEQVPLLGRKWHKACFSCASCNKRLEAVAASDHGGDIFCKSCYGRQFGPKGYGFAGGSGTGLSMEGCTGESDNIPHTAEAYNAPLRQFKKLDLQDSTNADGDNPDGQPKRRLGGGEYCPRCEQQVYIAERRIAAGNAYHEKCFCCMECSKKLDQGNVMERTGTGDIYCKICYNRKFGPKGYGYGGSGASVLLSP